MSLFDEPRRRKQYLTWRGLSGLAWLVVQAAASIGFLAFDAPPWVLRILS